MKTGSGKQRFGALLAVGCLLAASPAVYSEVILQYFNTTWNEIAARMPELAEAGYGALWLPPPFKAGSQYSVGFDTFDRFDIGTKNQMGGVPTRYGTGDDLKNMVETAHRFGIRVYFDNVMAHNGGPVPGYDENTPITAQPGFVPEDFHLLVRPDGTYRKRPNDWPDWGNEWQILNRNPFGLDIAQEDPNCNFGAYEGATFPKYYGVRQPSNTEYYLDTDLPVATNGTGDAVYTFANKEPYQDTNSNGRFDWTDTNGNGQHDVGEASEPFTDTGIDPSVSWRRTAQWGYGNGKYDMGNPGVENVNALLNRAARWFVDQSRCDGFRLDAVRHVPSYFFGKQDNPRDNSNWGYCGQIQEQFNITRGFSDWGNHRDTCFSSTLPRNDALFYGETLGEPPAWSGYCDAGMRIAHDGVMNRVGNSIGYNLSGMDSPGDGSYGVDTGMMYLMSHDQAWLYNGHFKLGHALILARAGIPIVYSDGFHHSGPPNWFPKWSTVPFLGQWDTHYMLNELDIHRNFARGDQVGLWADQDICAFERHDHREAADDVNAVVLLFAMARGWTSGQSMNRINGTAFPANAYLYNYSADGGGFYVRVGEDKKIYDLSWNPVIVPSGGYFAFSWRSPEPSDLWSCFGGTPITIYENGLQAGMVGVVRKDGEGGDANFNPYHVSDSNATDYSYTYFVPRVTVATNIRFAARADGSTVNLQMKLDAGMDLNGNTNRDNGPDIWPLAGTEMLCGYEQASKKLRQYPEKFAAVDSGRDKIGSAGAETYVAVIGTGATTNLSDGVNDWSTTYTAAWVYHNPNDTNNVSGQPAQRHFSPRAQDAVGSNITIWVKVGYSGQFTRVFFYYTTDGATWPEGAGGEGTPTTQVKEMTLGGADAADGNAQWWQTTLPAMTNGAILRYKIGTSKRQGDAGVTEDVPYPNDWTSITRKTKMMSVYEITNFNAAIASYFPHNDYGEQVTNGLKEGFHFLSARAFLQRSGQASIYNTFCQTFYLDAATPSGAIIYPASDGDTLWGSSYGVVVRGDRTVKDCWYRITDTQTNNDDSATGAANGNGAWVKAVQVSANPYIQTPHPNEWRFDYVNIAPSNDATIEVRLCEISSSTNMALGDSAGHFTTLTRTVHARGPDVRLYIAWPPVDGQTVGPGYVLKANFSKVLADGISSNDLINCFTLKLDSNTQARTQYNIVYNETLDYHALAFALPNLYDGVVDHQHLIEVTLDRDPYPTLTATRRIYSQPVDTPFIDFITPPVVDSNGQSYVVMLPDVASPAQTQRQYQVRVETAMTAADVRVVFTLGTGTLTETAGNPGTNGNYKTWDFLWSFPLTNNPAVIEGRFQFRADADTDSDWGDVEASVIRDTRVALRELVAASTNDTDDDDDGIPDYDEAIAKELPTTPSSEWINSDVHAWRIYGKTLPLSPDSDGDGLPDGLESGWRVPMTNLPGQLRTDTTTDTDGDTFKNFISDLDPPFYNTGDNYNKVPGVSLPDYGDKTELKAGTMTDPNNADSDFDGLPDGVEDANRNGWVDGDGEAIQPPWDPWLDRKWPTGDWTTNWVETDPNNSDSDADGLSDGYGEDKDFSGGIAGDTNGNRRWEAGELWTETDPLCPDTDRDGLPDGWESQYDLDPFDDGDTNHANMRTGLQVTNNVNGPQGDPDGDAVNNLSELVSGTNPRWFDTGAPPPAGSIVIGTGTAVVVGSVVNNNEFTDWSYRDLVALDNYDLYEQSNGGDVYYRPWATDALDSSRDLVAFYARDGGTNGDFYFRVDLHDLQAHAEDSGLDLYVVIDTGNPSIGEALLPDNVECLTAMRWEVVVAVYDSGSARVYINKPGSPDTRALTDTLEYSATNVMTRTKSDAHGFKSSYFNSDLDSVEFSISRQALLDAGWNGNPASLNYQVFTTRDGTTGGLGELDGPDIQDSIRTDWIAEDFAGISDGDVDSQRYQGRIALTTLSQWVGVNADNDCGKAIKVISVIHGNQAIQPGRVIQNLVNTGSGAGYHRPLNAHDAFRAPLTMHITPTLASALQWAKVDTNASPAWRDGPALNEHVARLVASNVVDLLASTFSDHMLPYFTQDFNADNAALASDFLDSIYGPVSAAAFWTPERLVDSDVLAKITNLGYSATFIDQFQHLRRWFGFNAAVGEDGYRINQINGVRCFAVSGRANDLRFDSLDNGPSLELRQILNRRARTGAWSGQHPQVLTFFSNWEDFTDKSDADAYDKNLRWLANKGWVQLVTPDRILSGQVDISLPSDGTGDVWNVVNRGAGLSLSKTSHDWIQYSAQNDYDHWYVGDALNQGLQGQHFQIRPGTNVPDEYGMLYFGGIVSSAWARVANLPDDGVGRMARAALHASVFETAYHNQSESPVNMTKFSTGDFAYPDDSYDTLAGFARIAQAQSRMAAVYQRVDQWQTAAPSITNVQTAAEDVDLDGEPEYLLFNDRLFGVFERIGGRLVAVWVRDILNDEVLQAAGNLASYAGKDTEEEGATNLVAGGAVDAHRTSCLKDWWANTTKYVNDLYTLEDRTNGWLATSSDAAVAKLVTLAPKSWQFGVQYTLSGALAGQRLYIRNGLSPNLYDLLVNGQRTLGGEADAGGLVRLANTNYATTVEASVGYGDAGHSAGFNPAARDDGNGSTNWTPRMRNQAQTHQVEIYGSNTFAFSLGFRAQPSDWNNDGLPNVWADGYGLPTNSQGGAEQDADDDGFSNRKEYIAGTSPLNGEDYLRTRTPSASGTGIVVRFETKTRREYFIRYAHSLIEPDWSLATANGIPGTGGLYEWLDNGSLTDPDPSAVTSRYYKIAVDLPQ